MNNQILECFHNANEFLEVAGLIDDKRYIFFECGKTNYLSPLITNLSFSVELYFKTMIMFEKNNDEIVMGHKLKELFDILEKLNPVIAKQIEKDFNENYKFVIGFREIIKICNNAFTNFRYLYENGTKNIYTTALSNIASLLKMFCENHYNLK